MEDSYKEAARERARERFCRDQIARLLAPWAVYKATYRRELLLFSSGYAIVVGARELFLESDRGQK